MFVVMLDMMMIMFVHIMILNTLMQIMLGFVDIIYMQYKTIQITLQITLNKILNYRFVCIVCILMEFLVKKPIKLSINLLSGVPNNG